MKDPFAYHAPNVEQLETIKTVRPHFGALRDIIEANIPAGRERALAVTHLQTAMMFAVCAIILADEESCQA